MLASIISCTAILWLLGHCTTAITAINPITEQLIVAQFRVTGLEAG